MDRGWWDRGKALFFECLDLPRSERESFLERACREDLDLRRLVEGLLSQDDRDGPRGEPLSSSELMDGLDPNLGRRLGPWVLERVLGRGGMATVFAARRVDGHFEQEVAIKLLRRGMDTEDVLERFRTERQILARLQHPCIARLLDGGATEEGLPYLVMELVEGAPIDRYCRERELPIDERLQLVQRVCDAVQRAHDLGVVHRDLKPSNLLVTAEGLPKLLDFGIAKVLAATSSLQTVDVTATELRLLTPEYASPEQIAGDVPSPRTDVHGLGVVLYELLSGRRPYRAATSRRRDLERLILERDPPPPSAVAPGGRSIPRELDTIVLKALRKEPHLRYASPRELQDDLERFLGGRPILARAPTWRYRTVKLWRRNRALISALGVAAAAALTGLLVIASWFAPSPETRVRRRQEEYAALLMESMLAFERFDVDAAYHILMRAPEEDRGWEWRYLLGRCDRSAETLATMDRGFMGLAYDPATGRLVAGDHDGNLLVHDPSTGAVTEYPSGQAAVIKDIVFSEDGSRMAVLFQDAIVALVDPRSMEIVRSWPVGSGHFTRGLDLDEGRTLALATKEGLVFRDLESGVVDRVETIAGVVDLAFLPGDRVAFTSQDASVRILARESGEIRLVTSLLGSGAVMDRFPLAVSPDGSMLAVGNARELKVLSVESGRELTSVRVHGFIEEIAFAPDGAQLAVALVDASVSLVGVPSGEEQGVLLGHWGQVRSVAYSPDGRRIGTAGDGVKLWERESESHVIVLGTFSSEPSFVLSPAGDRLAFPAGLAPTGNGIGLWDLARGGLLWTGRSRNNATSMAWSPDGALLLAGSYDGRLELWDGAEGNLLRDVRAHSDAVRAMSSNGAEWVATGSQDGTVKLWSWGDLRPVATSAPTGDEVSALAFAPDGSLLAAGFTGGGVVLFSVPDLGRVKLGEHFNEYHPTEPQRVHAVAYRGDGRQIASASVDFTVRLWDPQARRPVGVLRGHSASVLAVAYTPDGSRLVSASLDGTVRFWDPDTGNALAILHPPGLAGPLRATFSADGLRLFVMDMAGRIEVLSLPEGSARDSSGAVPAVLAQNR